MENVTISQTIKYMLVYNDGYQNYALDLVEQFQFTAVLRGVESWQSIPLDSPQSVQNLWESITVELVLSAPRRRKSSRQTVSWVDSCSVSEEL